MYEYKIVASVDYNPEALFNELGLEGWKLVSVAVTLNNTIVAYFMRLKNAT